MARARQKKSTVKPKIRLGVKKDDIVEVIAGKDRGSRGKVLWTVPGKRQVVVQNLNMVTKHLRRSQDAPQGGRLEREAPLHVSNVKVVTGE